jgi:hypothetical protein
MTSEPDASRRQRVRSTLSEFKERERLRGTTMPDSFRAAVVSEMGQAFSPPYQIPITVVVNAVLMAAFWFLVPRSLMFSVTSPLAFPVVLASWMYSDVPATNVLAPDRVRSLAALDDPKMMNRLLGAKAAVLWIFVAPFCSLIALFSGIKHHNPLIAVTAMLAICVVPIGCLPVAALVGIRWPYHPLELRYRWEHRKPFFRMIVRWTVLILVPYGLVPMLSVIMIVPALVILVRSHEDNSYVVNFINEIVGKLGIHVAPGTHPMSNQMFMLCVGVTCVIAVATWIFGRWANLRLIKRRRTPIEEWLSDPTMG